MSPVVIDPALDLLTTEQVVAAGTRHPRVFLEATPGSGKTTVAAQRFGAQRYRRSTGPDGRPDDRAIVAVSFTRSATWELHGRVRRSWGPSALKWPHRIVTLDTIICELLTHLLTMGVLRWPGGHTHLDVYDSWKVLVRHAPMRSVTHLTLAGRDVQISKYYDTDRKLRPEPDGYTRLINQGICTHDDVRRVLAQSLKHPDVVDSVIARFATPMRALIVDEVFDANKLDIAVVELALQAGIEVTVVGDPWQALYGFRGARPDLVRELLARTDDIVRLPLSQSFRWRSHEQEALATALRNGVAVELSRCYVQDVLTEGIDVVLACKWEDLWNTGAFVLPLAWGSAKGNLVEAATTMLLNQVTGTVLSQRATYLNDALATLGITDPDATRRLEPALQDVLELLVDADTKARLNRAYHALMAAVRQESPRDFPPKSHGNYTSRLARLRQRLIFGERIIPGMTVHQAKGREWDSVALRLDDAEIAQLRAGLTSNNEKHRQLYVACTRARVRTSHL